MFSYEEDEDYFFRRTNDTDSSSQGSPLEQWHITWIVAGVSAFVVLILAILGIYVYKRCAKRHETLHAVMEHSEGGNAMPFSKTRRDLDVSREDEHVLLHSDHLAVEEGVSVQMYSLGGGEQGEDGSHPQHVEDTDVGF